MNKLYAFMFLEASSCQNGPILGTKRNTSLCWKHPAVKWSEIIVGSSWTIAGAVEEIARILCWVTATWQLCGRHSTTGMELKSPLISSHFMRFPHKGIGSWAKSWTGYILDNFWELSTCMATIKESKKKKETRSKIINLNWAELGWLLMHHTKKKLVQTSLMYH